MTQRLPRCVLSHPPRCHLMWRNAEAAKLVLMTVDISFCVFWTPRPLAVSLVVYKATRIYSEQIKGCFRFFFDIKNLRPLKNSKGVVYTLRCLKKFREAAIEF